MTEVSIFNVADIQVKGMVVVVAIDDGTRLLRDFKHLFEEFRLQREPCFMYVVQDILALIQAYVSTISLSMRKKNEGLTRKTTPPSSK